MLSRNSATLNRCSSQLSNPVIATGNTGAGTISCNPLGSGTIGCSIGVFSNNSPFGSTDYIREIFSGNGQTQTLITISFDVAGNAKPGLKALTLSNVNTSNDLAELLTIGSSNGAVLIAPLP